MTTAFVPKHFPRTRLPSGCVLTDAQQYQYDVLRTVGGKLVQDRHGWWRHESPDVRKKVYGLNATAMWKLVQFGLVEAVGGTLKETWFLLPTLAKDVPGPRYEQVNQITKEVP